MTGIAAIVYMVIIKLLGLIENVSLHFVTGIILVIGVVMAIKSHKQKKDGNLNYLEGIGVGFVVGLVAAILFTIFQLLADSVFNLAMSYPYMADDAYGEGGSIGLMAILWILFGSVIGTFVGYLAMQFFKRPDHKMSN